MAIRSATVQAKQPIVINPADLETQLQVYRGEVDEITGNGVMIYDAESCDNAASMASKAKELRERIQAHFKTTEDLLKAAQKAMKSAVSFITDPIEKRETEIRSEIRTFLADNREIECSGARIQKSKWKMQVTDEDELFRSMITTSQRKGLDGKMYTEITLDPKIRALFVYNEAKGNALASAITNTLPIPGTRIFQDEMLVVKGAE